MMKYFPRRLIVLKRIQSSWIVSIIENPEISNVPIEGIMILIALIVRIKHVYFLCENWKRIILRMYTNYLDLFHLNLHCHHDCHVIKACNSL